MNEPFFSVVIPIYQAESYLPHVLECVQNQTFSDFEVILIDDCSYDMSRKIAEKFAEDDSRIHVFKHYENRGQSAARNSGISAASGRYLMFMDADDEIDKDLLQLVYDSLVRNPAKLVVFGLVEEHYDKFGKLMKVREIKPIQAYYRTHNELRPSIIDLEVKTLYGYPWNKCYDLLYLRKLSLEFEDMPLLEDIVFNIQYCMDIDSLNLLDITPYHYKKRYESSLTNRFVSNYFELHRKRIFLILEQHQYWGICDDDVKKKLAGIFIRYIYSAMERNLDPRARMSQQERVSWRQNIARDPLFLKLIPYASGGSWVTSIMGRALKRGRVWESLFIARLICLVKNRCSSLFVLMKAGK